VVGTSKNSGTHTARAAAATPGPYGRAARLYWRAGFTCPLPLPAGRKDPVPKGYTGHDGALVSVKDLARWERTKGDGNIALHLLGPQVGIDVDAYDGKAGERSLRRAEAELGELPPTYISTARDDGISGIRLFRLPEGVEITKEAEHRIVEAFGEPVETNGHARQASNIEIIRPDHRYVVVWPSTNPDADGALYRWIDPDGTFLEDEVPDRSRIAELPAAWVRFLCAPSAGSGDVGKVVREARAKAAKTKASAGRPQPVDRPVDDDDDQDMVAAGQGEREYTEREFEGFLKRGLREIRTAPRGQINQTLNDQAVWLWHFAPAFIADRELARALIKAQRAAWLAGGGSDDGDYTAARKTISSARTAARASWVAVPADPDMDGPDPIEAALDRADESGRTTQADTDEGGKTLAEDEHVSTKRTGIFFTDARFSEAVAELLRDEGFLFVAEMGWMTWTGTYWLREAKESGESKAIDVVRKWSLRRYRKIEQRLEQAVHDDLPDAEVNRLEAILEAWHAMLSRTRRSTVVADAKPQVSVSADVFDAHPDLLNTPSGVVDLRTGELGEHDPGLYFTRITRAPYLGSDHTHETWEKALRAIPEDVRDWVQMFMGQGCTGRLNTEGRLLLLDGGGSNGKGCLTNEGAVWTLGDYAVVVSENLLLANSNQHPTEKMALRGARLTLIDETPEARYLDTQRLKKLLDQPILPGARYLFKEEVRLVLQHTMIVMTNHVPAVTEFDHGTWRRLTRLRMPLKFMSTSDMPPKAERVGNERLADPLIKERLKEDPDVQAACLAWLVRGAMKWYAAGRCQPLGDEPGRIKTDVRDWRASGDLIMAYVDEWLEFGPMRGPEMVHVVAEELYRHFCEWAETQGHKPWSVRTFTSRWESHDLVKDRTTRSRLSSTGTHRPPSRTPDRFASNDLALPAMYTTVRGVKYRDVAGQGPVYLEDD